jgi:hypothetical protein
MHSFRFVKFFALVVLVGFSISQAWAQSVVSGEIDGSVTDPAGAVVPNAVVNLSSSETGTNESTTTSSSGAFRFALVKPGNYTLGVSVAGFRTVKLTVVASLGQATTIPIRLEVGVQSQTVEVTAESPLLHTENANLSTTVDEKSIDLIPSPGQDITNYAMTTPGVTVSSGSGYGNFTANGLPGTSNLYTVNGNDYNDPYLNLNNSGASNLLLGANELQEITVVTNGYTGEYGRAAGANVNYSTKSGTNQFHGNATWFYNGNVMNANDWFSNASTPVTPRPHEVSNQWAGSFGGPIKKNKLFFFYDNEGLRYVLPGGGPVFLPTTAFANAVIANLTANSPASVPFFTKIFSLYAGAPGIGRAASAPGNCGDLSGNTFNGVTFDNGPGTPGVVCAQTFRSTVNNLNTERLMSFTVDLNATQNDTFKFRYKQDRGIQATGTDPINSIFNANSVQPEDDGQMTWTHVLNSHTTNQFIMAGLWYSAIFGPTNLGASLSAFPTTIAFADGAPFNNLGGGNNVYPQGRNVTQYQFVDDFSWTKGAHGIKFGVNFRRNDISSFAAGPGTSGLLTVNSLTDFFNGVISTNGSTATANGGDLYTQSFANKIGQPVAYFSLGLYVQDEWRVNSKLKLTLALRADSNSDEVCQTNCFARPAGSFLTMDHNVNTPYNKSILTGLHKAFPSLQGVGWGPRAGFAWSPKNNLVVRGGFGIFTDLYQGLIGDRFITNLPNVTSFTLHDGAISPAVAGNVFAQAKANQAAFQSQFSTGGTLASIVAQAPNFTVPNLNTIVNNTNNPRYLEWNLQVEKALGTKTSFAVNYVGNHGSNLFIRNLGLNAYCTPTAATAAPSPSLATTIAHCPNGFADLPQAVPDQRFGILTELQNNGISNYDGVTATVSRRFSYGFQGTFNYTYSHSLDDISNGGLEPYNNNFYGGAASSFRVAIDPYNLRAHNYANSDYNFAHSVSATYFWELPIKSSNHFLNTAIGGWSISQTFFFKSGEPFSVYNSKIASSLLGNGSSQRILADFIGGTRSCSGPNQCLTASEFAPPVSPGTNSTGKPLTPSYTFAQTNFGNTNRNFFTGPHYFNSDFSLMKNFKVTERMTFTLGANAFNVFNHPNFDNPIGSISSGLFGQILETVTPPNSPYGNFQGAAVSGRVLQLALKFRF